MDKPRTWKYFSGMAMHELVLLKDFEALKTDRDRLLEALEIIDDEPNQLRDPDGAVEEYGIRAWYIAHEALLSRIPKPLEESES